MDPIRFCVVGCGNIGTRHLEVVTGEPRARLVGLCDIDDKVRARMSDKFGVPGYKDYGDLLARTECDIVSICTPHGLHAPMAIQAAQAHRHTLVEKPMALKTADAAAMIEAARANNVKLMVVKQNRFNRPIAYAKKALDDGRLGKVFLVNCNVLWNRNEAYYKNSVWRGRKDMEGGPLYTQASHFLDLLIWWFGDIVGVSAWTATKNHAIEIEDCGMANVVFAIGTMGSLNWTTCVYNKNYEGSITIIGERGTIKIGGLYLNKIEFWDVQSYPEPEATESVDRPNNYGEYQGSAANHDKVVESVVAKLLNERANVVEGDEGLRTIAAIEKIYASARNLG